MLMFFISLVEMTLSSPSLHGKAGDLIKVDIKQLFICVVEMTLSSLSLHRKPSESLLNHGISNGLDLGESRNRGAIAPVRKVKKKRKPITANLTGTRYDIGERSVFLSFN